MNMLMEMNQEIVGIKEASGVLQAPASKSFTQRALACALLAEGESIIVNASQCDDAVAALNIIQALGARVEKNEGNLIIQGGFSPTAEKLNCGESGFNIRFFTPIAGLSSSPLTLHGTGSLLKRPIGDLSALKHFGCSVETNGFPPVTIRGPLNGGCVEIDASLSSQFLSGLLTALPLAQSDSTVVVRALNSKPYVQMTLEVVKKFGIEIQAREDLTEFHIPGNQKYAACEYTVEGDYSSAAFWMVAAAINGSVTLSGLKEKSLQADAVVVDLLRQAGAIVRQTNDSVSVESSGSINAFSFNATDCPDLIPALSVLACFAQGECRIKGVTRLKAKESDRASALVSELSKMNARILVNQDELVIQPSKLQGALVDSHADHRIAMCLAIAGLNATGKTTIARSECVSKSYPKFFEDLNKLTGGEKQ